jgi:signal transduction histidine kinase
MTMGRTGSDNQRFFAVFRDISQLRRHEAELMSTRQRADRATSARTASLAKISHEIRAPLNAIIGFADVMIEQRFGPLGNERYVEYMKDIRASGERVIAIMNDMLDLSRIESGKLDLKLADQNLNEIVEQCVGILQPRANRERIIIRTSLAHALPPVVADAASLRQIATNLIADSIGLANAGGQVIVSTALTDDGSIVLKIRDTGHGLSETDIATATDPFRIDTSPDPVVSENGINLSLTKALVEANRAQFHVRSAAQSGTLIEVIFPAAGTGGR